MNRRVIDRVATAVLYEGYILYPYRPSVKNCQRWTFGGLYPKSFCRDGSEVPGNRTECLVRGTSETTVEVVGRFLHLTARQVGRIDPPLDRWPDGVEPAYEPMETLQVGDRVIATWQEAEEREVSAVKWTIAHLMREPVRVPFSFPSERWIEPLHKHNRDGCGTKAGPIVGVLVREQQALAGEVEVVAEPAAKGVYRLSACIRNLTSLAEGSDRDSALIRSLVSTHLLLGAEAGEFVSLLDPPADCRDAALRCRQSGLWPVLVGEEGSIDAMLAAPIILYDYPQLAPESPGDLFDATEIDEILSLRILTLTDAERQQVAGVDERTRAMLARTEALAETELARLHGTMTKDLP